MKRYKELWSKICTYNNFRKAYKNAIKGKKHYTEVKEIEKNPYKYLHALLDEVRNKEYKVSDYTIFDRFTGGKMREIYKLPMKDRIVQHAIMLHLEPIFRETFIQDTYASIKTRGIHLGMERLKRALKDTEYQYAMKLDIHKCYPSLDKEILKKKLSRKFEDKDLQWLLNSIIDSCEKGVPIGNYTSQYFNNFYFSDFDHWCKEKKGCKYYFRYCDDIVILGKSKEWLHKLLDEIREQMELLNVRLKDNYQIYPIDKHGVDFLGYITYRDYIRVRKITKKHFISKVLDVDKQHITKKQVNMLGSYWGIFVHADCRNLWKKYIGVKQFKDLGVRTHDRLFVKDVVGIPIIIEGVAFYYRKKDRWLRIIANYTDNDGVKHEKAYIHTQGCKLIDVAEQLCRSMFPFETVIKEDSRGYYEFT